MKRERTPVRLFVIAAAADAAYQTELEKHLSPLWQQGLLENWQSVQPGEQVEEAFIQAKLILLLLSADFSTESVCQEQMQRALERQRKGEVKVLPILLRPVELTNAPFMHLAMVPTNELAVTVWANQDAAWTHITEGIRCVLEGQPLPVIGEGELEARYTVEHQQTVYGQTIGEHNEIHQHYYLPASPPPAPAAAPVKPVWMVPTSRLSSVAQQNRLRLLKRVRQTWIKGVFEQSLQHAALMALDLQEQPHALANPWQLEVQETNQPARLLPAGTSIVEVYDHADSELLLLGEPGAGKTTLLLELTRTLLERAEGEEREPMPIVFNLSSWAVKRQPLVIWLREELRTKYQVSYEISRTWLHTDRILALLDGLDEVAKDAREQCVQAINTYHQRRLQEQGTAPLVVCCRSEEYMALPTRVALQQAVAIQPLTGEQIENYLQSTHGQLDGLRVALRQDPELYALAQRPLMLSVFTLAYQEVASKDIPTQETREVLQRQVFTAYIERMLKHRSIPRQCSREGLLRQLTFIAARMQQHQQTVLYLENLQPDWLIQLRRRLLYRQTIGLVSGLVAALLFYVTFIPVSGGGIYGFVRGLGGGVSLGVSLGLFAGLFYGLSPIQPREMFTWAWRWTKRNVGIGVAVGLVFGLVVELLNGLRYSREGGVSLYIPLFMSIYPSTAGLLSALLASLLTVLAFGFYTDKLDDQARLVPNQGIWRSARNGLLFSLVIGFLVGIGSEQFYALFYPRGYTPATLIGFGVITGLLTGLGCGLGAFLQHFSLRFWLWCFGSLSWSLIPLLDEAAHRVLLRKVGGGYIFIHRQLLDYFASLETPSSLHQCSSADSRVSAKK